MEAPRHLANHLVRTVSGPMWHGPSLIEVLDGISWEQADVRPVAGAHTVRELVSHITAWAEITRERLAGRAAREATPDEDWPPLPPPSPEEWASAKERLVRAHELLAADVSALDEAALRRKVPGHEYPAGVMLHGVIEHGTYHGGQVALLKRAMAVLAG
jgi:uncharacterized damage-inducible protein DinB